MIGEILAGPYNEKIAQFYVEGIVKSIVEAASHKVPAYIGIGYTKLEELAQFRSTWPESAPVLENDLAIFKITKEDGTPLAVMCNFAMHPTVLKADNMYFSADFVGECRKMLQETLGSDITCVYFNGAQAELVPQEVGGIGKKVADAVCELWDKTPVSSTFQCNVQTHEYAFVPMTTPYGLSIPLERYETSLSILTVNNDHLFVAVPGELSAIYNSQLVKDAHKKGYSHLSIFGLVNDAHGYILTPEEWRAKTQESALSFGGEFYGNEVVDQIMKAYAVMPTSPSAR